MVGSPSKMEQFDSDKFIYYTINKSLKYLMHNYLGILIKYGINKII